MAHICGSTAPKFDLNGTVFTGLASPKRGATETAVWHVRLAPGTAPTAHQLTREEIFVCVSGSGTAQIGNQNHAVETGDALIVPPQTDFALSNLGVEEFQLLVIFPVGGQAVLPGKAPFTPPWAQ